jgi:hypothetical protein
MRGWLIYLPVILTVLVGSAPNISASGESSRPMFVSLPRLALTQPERVVRFNCEVAGPIIVRIKTPYGWQMKIENGTSNLVATTASVEANIVDGAAAFTRKDLSYFKHFIEVQYLKLTPERGPVDIRVTLWISTDEDMTKYRQVKFSARQLLMTPDAQEN